MSETFYVARDPGELRQIRADLGLRQRDLAALIREQNPQDKRAGSVAPIWRAENGIPIKHLSASRIARVLKVEFEAIFEPAEAVAS